MPACRETQSTPLSYADCTDSLKNLAMHSPRRNTSELSLGVPRRPGLVGGQTYGVDKRVVNTSRLAS